MIRVTASSLVWPRVSCRAWSTRDEDVFKDSLAPLLISGGRLLPGVGGRKLSGYRLLTGRRLLSGSSLLATNLRPVWGSTKETAPVRITWVRCAIRLRSRMAGKEKIR